jgi:transposase
MRADDTRRLSPAALDVLRVRVIKAVAGGMTQSEASRVFGVSRQSVIAWQKRYRERGRGGLRSRRRGRPRRSRLSSIQAAQTVRLIIQRCPDQLRLPFALWTREAVQLFLRRRFGVRVSIWTVGRYLREWDLTPQKPVRRAYEQNPDEVRQWLERDYPVIREAARRAGAEIQWGDEMGMRSDHQAGRTWGRRGRTPVVPGTGKRFRCSMISTITNRGQLRFMVFCERFTGRVFIRFLRRLTRETKRVVYLIVDGHPVHKGRLVKNYLRDHSAEIRLFLLPAYSPELNPDELLNNDVKSNAIGRRRPHDLVEMKAEARSYLRSRQRQPAVVRSYFAEEHVRYAAT